MADIIDTIGRVTSEFEQVRDRANNYLEEVRNTNKRVTQDVKYHLELAVDLIGEVGVTIVNLRGVSWDIGKRVRGSKTPFDLSVSNLRGEIKDMIYALSQLNAALSETTRSLRSFLAY